MVADTNPEYVLPIIWLIAIVLLLLFLKLWSTSSDVFPHVSPTKNAFPDAHVRLLIIIMYSYSA